MTDSKLNKNDCIALLKDKFTSLQEKGINRYPKRSDFDEYQVVAIKAFLGPWPRALEAAGIKPPRDFDQKIRNREKRIRARKNRTMSKKNAETSI